MSTFHIIFPGGDRTKLTVVELSDACYYELNQYIRASRNEFLTEEEAQKYAKELAANHSLKVQNDTTFLD